MKGLLIRVAVDQSEGGGSWNGPVDSHSRCFAYVPIPESRASHPRLNKPYESVASALVSLGCSLPSHLAGKNMHLDPDFDYLTYGDQGNRANQIQSKLRTGDLLAFYAGLQDVRRAQRLVYAIIGLYIVEEIIPAVAVPAARWHENAHTRRVLTPGSNDIVVRASNAISGRLERCIPIGDYQGRAYRVCPKLLEEWGGLSVSNGYLQRSAQMPEFSDADRFYKWFCAQKVKLVKQNN